MRALSYGSQNNKSKVQIKAFKVVAFPTTKNINVFRFIKEIKGIVTLPIQEFEKSSDIKGFISKQWADMFKNYLSSLRNEKEDRKIESSVNEMKALIQKMDIMLDSVGKNVLSKDNPKEYESVVNQQEIVSFCNLLVDVLTLRFDATKELDDADKRKEIIINYLEALNEIKDLGISKVTVEEIDIVEDILDKYGLYYYRLREDLRMVENKMDLLSNETNRAKVIETMSEDEYFNKLIKRTKF